MTYSYKCEACEFEWDAVLPMSDREKPLSDPCPHCAESGHIKKTITGAPHFSYEGHGSLLRKCGSDWNDHLKRIHKAAGMKSKIETR